MVLGQSYRNPALLAKMAATLAQLTGGRFVLGIGAGWQEDEYLAYDFPFPSPGVRIEQMGEAIDLIRTMWTDSPATFEGRHYRVQGAYCEPRPTPLPRILVGGQGPRLMRMVAAKADAWVWDGPLEMYRVPQERLEQSCAEIGRDIRSIHQVAEFDVYLPELGPTFRSRTTAATWTSTPRRLDRQPTTPSVKSPASSRSACPSSAATSGISDRSRSSATR